MGSPSKNYSSRRGTTRCRSRRCASRSRRSACTTCSSTSTFRSVDAADWRLDIGGLVERPLSLRSRRAEGASGADACGDARVRGERACAPRAAVAEPAVAPRGGRQLRVDGHAAGAAPPRGRARAGRGGRRVHRSRPWHSGRRRAPVRAEPHGRRRVARRRLARLRRERRAAAAAARLSAATARSGLVRDDAREVAAHDHGERRAVPRLAAGGRVPASRIGGRGWVRR